MVHDRALPVSAERKPAARLSPAFPVTTLKTGPSVTRQSDTPLGRTCYRPTTRRHTRNRREVRHTWVYVLSLSSSQAPRNQARTYVIPRWSSLDAFSAKKNIE